MAGEHRPEAITAQWIQLLHRLFNRKVSLIVHGTPIFAVNFIANVSCSKKRDG